MALVLSCNGLSKSHGGRPLFDGVSIGVDDSARLGIIGPNGSGKTTFLEVLAGMQPPDGGERSVRKLARLGYVPQDSVFEPGKTIREVLEETLKDSPLDEMERSVQIGVALGKAGFEQDDLYPSELSGGWKKRLAIAAELVKEPDLLLLDEPTNHLDLDAIAWLERLLKSERFAVVFVSHDRYFLENVASEIAEINGAYPGGLYRAAGTYSVFLEKREEFLTSQAKRQETLANLVKREIEWLRRGPKARTGKSQSRIDAAHDLMHELDTVAARNKTGTTDLKFTGSDRKTKRLVTAEGIAKTLGGRTLFRDLDLVLGPGTRLGIVGPNGSGKTTLMKVLLGSLEHDEGTVRRAKNLSSVLLDQHRTELDPEVTLRRALAPDGDSVIFRDKPLHVAGWAKRFLFREEQLQLPVGQLSGGEKARVAIAKLMLREADLLALDEPTNDLDIPTLEVLEDQLLDFPGALLLVTHDRYLLDRVCNLVVGLDGDGSAALFADYAQWERARTEKRRPKQKVATAPRPAKVEGKPKKLSYKEQLEFDGMEQRILEAEAELEEALADMNNPEGVSDPAVVLARQQRLDKAQTEVDQLYVRWEELEAKTA